MKKSTKELNDLGLTKELLTCFFKYSSIDSFKNSKANTRVQEGILKCVKHVKK